MTKQLSLTALFLAAAVLYGGTLFAANPLFVDVTESSGAGDRGSGKGVAFADIDGDGKWDLYISNKGGRNVLYRNESTPGHIKFADITAMAGDVGDDSGYSMGSSFADVDNDGKPDLFIAKGGRYEIQSNRLMHNESTPGRISFRDITQEAGLEGKFFTYGSAWTDYDHDGKLDLYIANYGVGAKNHLYHNESTPGHIKFTDVTDQAGLALSAWSWSATWADVNGDGWDDLYVVCGRYPAGEPSHLFMNNADGTFREVTKAAGVENGNWALGAAFADFDNDGDLDLFVSNYVGPNKMYLNDGRGLFSDVSEKLGLAHKGWGKGPTWGDIDGDGRMELYEGDCKLANQLYKWNGEKFIDIVGQANILKNEGVRTKGTCFSDMDGDGQLDLYVVNWNVQNRVYQNAAVGKNWLKVQTTGTVSNKFGIGSKIVVYPAGHAGEKQKLVATREMQTATGFCTQPPQEVHFGLDSAKRYDVVVTFPSGITETVRNVATGQTLKVVEPEGKRIAGK